jgi:cyclophilin family peptidyl-prolyl cis-trans isomerase
LIVQFKFKQVGWNFTAKSEYDNKNQTLCIAQSSGKRNNDSIFFVTLDTHKYVLLDDPALFKGSKTLIDNVYYPHWSVCKLFSLTDQKNNCETLFKKFKSFSSHEKIGSFMVICVCFRE